MVQKVLSVLALSLLFIASSYASDSEAKKLNITWLQDIPSNITFLSNPHSYIKGMIMTFSAETEKENMEFTVIAETIAWTETKLKKSALFQGVQRELLKKGYQADVKVKLVSCSILPGFPLNSVDFENGDRATCSFNEFEKIPSVFQIKTRESKMVLMPVDSITPMCGQKPN